MSVTYPTNTKQMSQLVEFYADTMDSQVAVAKGMETSQLMKSYMDTKNSEFAVEYGKPLLLDLPPVVTLEITQKLNLPSRILLSQTCKEMRAYLSPKCLSTFAMISPAARLKCRSMLEDHLPDYWLCYECNQLHLVDLEDIPASKEAMLIERPYSEPCAAAEPRSSRHRLTTRYALANRHVRLAVKYERMVGHQREEYLEKLLQGFEYSTSIFSTFYRFSVKPEVIGGHFLVKATHSYKPMYSYQPTEGPELDLCPHLTAKIDWISRGSPCVSVKGSGIDVEGDKMSYDGHEIKVHCCARCPLDYLVSLGTDERPDEIYLRTWTDYGAGLTPNDPYWRSHIFNATESGVAYRRRVFRWKGGFPPLMMAYEMGKSALEAPQT